MQKYDKINGILSLKWLLIEEHIQMNLEKLAFKVLSYGNLETHSEHKGSIEKKFKKERFYGKKYCDQILGIR